MSRKHADNLALLYPENAAVQRLVREVGGLEPYEFITKLESYKQGE